MSTIKTIAPPSVEKIRTLSSSDVVPPGWFSRHDLEKAWNMRSAYTAKLTRDAVETGKAEMKKFRVQRGSFMMKVPHYRFK